MPKIKARIQQLGAFNEPLSAAGSEPADIATALDERLEQLCKELGIVSDDKHRSLCIELLVGMGIRGFQVVDKAQKRGGGAPVVWTLRLHVALIKSVKDHMSEEHTLQGAIGHARNVFAKTLSKPKLTDQTVRAEYYRAKRFVKSFPHVTAAMLSATLEIAGGAGTDFFNFVRDGATIYKGDNIQSIAAAHIVQHRRKMAPSSAT